MVTRTQPPHLPASRPCLFPTLRGLALLVFLLASHALADQNWEKILREARGQTVYMNAWGGSESVNSYLHWAGQQLEKQYGLHLRHVKISNISSVVSRLMAEKAAHRQRGGSVDLLWLNGESFRTLYDSGLLYGPFVADLPNWRFVDSRANPATVHDGGMPTRGAEAPWGLARLAFLHNSRRVPAPPDSARQLLAFCHEHPGRFTYPAPPDFVGVAFLEQILSELTPDPSLLQKPTSVKDERFDRITAPLWAFLDELHPLLWQGGRRFVLSYPAMKPLLADGALDIALTFNPAEATAAIREGTLPASTGTYVHSGGTLGNAHFLAIPANSDARAAALVTINFLLSPRAQRRKANPDIWGDPSALSPELLSESDRQALLALPRHSAGLDVRQLGPGLARTPSLLGTGTQKPLATALPCRLRVMADGLCVARPA